MSSTFEAFVEAHEAQLRHLQVPKPLYEMLFAKLTEETFDAGSFVSFAERDDDEQQSSRHPSRYKVLALQDMSAESVIFLSDHACTFRSKDDHRQQLTSFPNLLVRLVRLMNLDTQLPIPDVLSEFESDVDAVLSANDELLQ
jgi:tubulin--tyrosine ligase-like protein 12